MFIDQLHWFWGSDGKHVGRWLRRSGSVVILHALRRHQEQPSEWRRAYEIPRHRRLRHSGLPSLWTSRVLRRTSGRLPQGFSHQRHHFSSLFEDSVLHEPTDCCCCWTCLMMPMMTTAFAIWDNSYNKILRRFPWSEDYSVDAEQATCNAGANTRIIGEQSSMWEEEVEVETRVEIEEEIEVEIEIHGREGKGEGIANGGMGLHENGYTAELGHSCSVRHR